MLVKAMLLVGGSLFSGSTRKRILRWFGAWPRDGRISRFTTAILILSVGMATSWMRRMEVAQDQWLYGIFRTFGIGAARDLDESAQAAQYYRLSADQGNSTGQWLYGQCLELGLGVDLDLVAATRYYRLSADQGNSDGQWLYGRCLELGRGVDLDLVVAARYYRLSANQGNSHASIYLSRLLS
jgi:TPR repeat protein